MCACVHAKPLQSCLNFCDLMDCNPPGSSVHGILQARTLESVAMPSSRGSSDPGIKPVPLKSPALAGGFFTTSTTGEGPTPFQTLLILAPERLFLKPNFHRPYLTESEVSLRERKASQIPRPTSYCSPALYSSPFRH